MERNLLRRVETCFPILDPELAQRVLRRRARQLPAPTTSRPGACDADGSYRRIAARRGANARIRRRARCWQKLCAMSDDIARPRETRPAAAGRRSARRGRPRLEQLPHGGGALRCSGSCASSTACATRAPGRGLDGKGGLRAGSAACARSTASSASASACATSRRERVRAIATNTVRQLRQPQTFLLPAETALGHEIEVVSGREEARLIYLGVAHGKPAARQAAPGDRHRRRLDRIHHRRGLRGARTRKPADGLHRHHAPFLRRRQAVAQALEAGATEITAEFQQFAAAYRCLGWQEVIGSSGTIKAIGDIAQAMKLTSGAVTGAAIDAIRDRLLGFDTIDDIDLPGLSGGPPAGDRRRPADPRRRLRRARARSACRSATRAARRRAVRHARPRRRARSARRLDPRADASATASTRRRPRASKRPRWRCSTRSPKPGTCRRRPRDCWPGPRASTRSAWRSRTASTTCTAPTWSNIPTSPASRDRNSSSSPRWCARIGAASRRARSKRFPIACSPRRSAPRRCCASRCCCIARTRPTSFRAWTRARPTTR